MMYSRLVVASRSRGSSFCYHPFAAAATATASFLHSSSTPKNKPTHLEGKPDETPSKAPGDSNKENPVFDITKNWNDAQNDARDFWKSFVFTEQEEKKPDAKEEPSGKKEKENKMSSLLDGGAFGEKIQKFFGGPESGKEGASSNEKAEENSARDFKDMAKSFVAVLASKNNASEDSVQNIVRQARESAEEGDIADSKSLDEVLTVLLRYANDLKNIGEKFLGDVDLTKVYPTSLFYFVELEDSIKTPSWKRRKHRFCPGIDLEYMDELNDYLELADLSYADTREEIQEGLEHNKTPFEVVLVDTNSRPNRPAHFIAVKRAQAKWSNSLEVIMCVRGTKTFGDALTDLLCDYKDYRGGKAHSGVLEGGQYLVQKHKPLLLKLLKSSGKRKMKLTLVGHSLGAGAASIIGMELNDDPKFEVEVFGFGCPALVSKELSEGAKGYITTVVCDDDCVPRMSASSVVNAILDIMEYDYRPNAKRDVRHAIFELRRMYPMLINKTIGESIQEFVDPLLDDTLGVSIKEPTTKRMETTLYPPGKIIHFYRDGVGVSGSVCPCDFFDELNISRRMVHDHLFQTGYQQIFLELMRQHHQDHHFTFDDAEKKK